MQELLEIGGLLLLSATKFLFVPPLSAYLGYSFLQSVLISISGGMIGFFAFFYFGAFIKKVVNRYYKPKKTSPFSRINRIIVKVKSKYGLWGLAILSPCLLSIPLGSILASLYYADDKKTLPMFIGSIVIWSLILSTSALLF